MTKALFIVSSGPDRGVFESQVLEYGRFLRTLGVEFRYLVFDGLRGWLRGRQSTADRIARLRVSFDARIDLYGLPLPVTRLGLTAATHLVMRAAVEARSRRLLLQARGLEAAWAALEARRRLPDAVVLYDARADAVAEATMTAAHATTSVERRRSQRRAKQLEMLERRVCAESDHVLTVSTALKARVCAVGSRSTDSVTVVPCCVEPSRFVLDSALRDGTRRQLNLQDRLIFVYSGSLSTWQAAGRMVSLMTGIRRRLPHSHLLLLSGDIRATRDAFADLIASRACTVVDCHYASVGAYLNAADVGLLLREDDPVNRVACPVKFAEYQAAGLPVVTTHGIGDVTSYLQESGFGVVINLEASPAEQALDVLTALRTHNWVTRRPEIREAAIGRFSRESYRNAYLAVLHTLGIDASVPSSAAEVPLSAMAYDPT